jgi:hypothetical protein
MPDPDLSHFDKWLRANEATIADAGRAGLSIYQSKMKNFKDPCKGWMPGRIRVLLGACRFWATGSGEWEEHWSTAACS